MSVEFQFESLQEMLVMSGHGPFVWGAYALTIVSLLLLVVQVRMRKRDVAQMVHVAQLKATQIHKDVESGAS